MSRKIMSTEVGCSWKRIHIRLNIFLLFVIFLVLIALRRKHRACYKHRVQTNKPIPTCFRTGSNSSIRIRQWPFNKRSSGAFVIDSVQRQTHNIRLLFNLYPAHSVRTHDSKTSSRLINNNKNETFTFNFLICTILKNVKPQIILNTT